MKEVVLKKGRQTSWLFGHPWLFSGALQTMPTVESGALVHVKSHEGSSLGIGTLNPKQSLALRMLTDKVEPINVSWFTQKFKALFEYRFRFLNKETTAFRLCFGESDGIAGLVVDCYGGNAAVQVNTKGMEHLLPQIIQALKKLGMKEIVPCAGGLEGALVSKPLPICVEALENGLKILVPLGGGQKMGWFCDQRDNRLLVQKLAPKTMLNLFSYSGGFSLAALLGGAKRVVNVDRDAFALSLFDEMKKLNRLAGQSENISSDIWDYLRASNETFDLVIADPPAFVKQAAKKAAGLKGYLDLIEGAIGRVQKGGLLMITSCSHFVQSEDLAWVLRQAFAKTKRHFQVVSSLGQPFDHPVPVFFPEGAYLKGFLLCEI